MNESLSPIIQPPPHPSPSTALAYMPVRDMNAACLPQAPSNEMPNHIVQVHLLQAHPLHPQSQLQPRCQAMGLSAPTIQVSIPYPCHCCLGSQPNNLPWSTDEYSRARPSPATANTHVQPPGRILGPSYEASSSPVAGPRRKPNGSNDHPLPSKKWATLYSPSLKRFISVLASLEHDSPVNWISEKLLRQSNSSFTTVKYTSYDSPQGHRLESCRQVKADWRGSTGKTYSDSFLVFSSDGPEATLDLVMGNAILRKLGEVAFLSQRPDDSQDQRRQ